MENFIGCLRYFSPKELLRLFCFPVEHYSFPESESLTRRKKYSLIGNSLNVKVVEVLVGILLGKY